VLAADVLQATINKAYIENLLRTPIPNPFGHDYPIVQYADGTTVIIPA
jgi:hypothetical protein